VATETELEALSSRELHDKAVHRALTHADVGFLWELLRAIPAAEALEGDPVESEWDAVKVSGLLGDAIDSGDGAIADALRPLYIDYLAKHSKQ
jgi:hypothetical protein